MSLFPRPLLPSLQVTLLPETPQTPSSKAAGPGASARPFPNSPSAPSSSPTQTQARDVAIAKDMLQAVFRVAADCTVPQRRFSGYSPELVLRSVRAMVDDDLTMQLVGALQAAARQYAEDCVAALTAQLPPAHEQADHASEMDDDGDEEAAAARSRTCLASVQLLAHLVTCWERLQQGLTELSSVWVYADQWCQARAGTGVPRSLTAAATQEMCEVLCRHRQVGAAALDGYVAVLRASLADTTTALLAAARSTAPAAAMTTASSSATSPRRPSLEADTPASLAVLTHPPSLAVLDAPLRHRLLRLFTELTRATQLFTPVVEPAVVQAVRGHYEGVAHTLWADDVSAGVFFRFCDGALKHVGPMAAAVFHPSTTPLLEEALQAVLVSTVGAEVLKRDFVLLMERQAYATLRLGWRLLSASAHVRSSPVVTTLFHEYVMDCGQRIMEEVVPGSTKAATVAAAHVLPRDRPFLAVRHVLGLLEQGTQTIARCFAECEKDFKVTLHEDLQTILGAYPNAFSEQLAAYQDAIMKEVEVRHVPVSAVLATTTTASAAAAVDENEEERDGAAPGSDAAAPLRRARAETTSAPAAASVSLTPSGTAAAVLSSVVGAGDAEEEEKDGGDGVAIGTAALRLAAPLPADMAEATSVLRRIAVIYSYHPKKELFEAAYWRDFARRCLHAHRKLNAKVESFFIGYLRDICGLSFTSKFEGMLTDLTASAELTSEYKTWAAEQQQLPPELPEASATTSREPEVHLFVLAQSYWPKYASLPPGFYVPPPLQAITQAVERFYAARFTNRHLTWQHPLSHATLLARLTPQSTPLTMTGTYTQCVLLMRLDAVHDRGVTVVTAKALCDALGLDMASAEVLWSLQGLCHPRFRLVLREGSADTASTTLAEEEEPAPQRPSAELENEEEDSAPAGAKPAASGAASSGTAAAAAAVTLAPTDRLRLNLDFTSATSKVRIPLQTRIRGAGTAAAADGTSRGSRTAENGAHLIEVALVSCLKAQRTMSHADVTSAVAARLPFAVTTAALKKAMDKMIERGFIVRGKDNTYIYSA